MSSLLTPKQAIFRASLQITIIAALFALTLPANAQNFTVVHSFTGGGDGSLPNSLTIDRHGNFYGTTESGGPYGDGSVFKMAHHNSAWILVPLYGFPGINDGFIPMGVVVGPDGSLYGTTYEGGDGSPHNAGVVFRLTPPPNACAGVACPWTETVLHAFGGSNLDGANPTNGNLVFDGAGNLYGTTSAGAGGNDCGELGCGTVFEISPSNGGWITETIYPFANGTDNAPIAGVIFDSAGNLYGTASNGGTTGAGAIYQLTLANGSWSHNILHNLSGSTDGGEPFAGLLLDSAGNFYGATTQAGPVSGGTVFELSPSGESWNFGLIHSFVGGQHHGGPEANLTMDAAGNLYGATAYDGPLGCGNVFKLAPSNGSWVYTSLHDFTCGADGEAGSSRVVIDAAGNLYGTAAYGGVVNQACPQGCGVVWEITP